MTGKLKSRILHSISGFVLIVLIPYIHIGIFHSMLWVPNKIPVNRSACTCNCWDTIFKGSYENGKRIGYKHLYFNSTKQTFSIWIITIAAFLTFYEVVKYLLKLYADGYMRYSMAFVLLLDIYPHYYSWWNYFNYLNDDFYNQFTHQMFFTVTELISSAIILRMCSSKIDLSPELLIVVLSINIAHIFIGGLDQFIQQLIFMKGQTFQRTRNLGFLIPDIIHIVIPLIVYRKCTGRTCDRMFSRKQLLLLFCSALFLFLFGKLVLK